MNNQIKLRKISNILSKKIFNSELNKNFFKFPYKHLIIDHAIDNKIINL